MADKEISAQYFTVTIAGEEDCVLTPVAMSPPQLLRYAIQKKNAQLVFCADCDHKAPAIKRAFSKGLKDESVPLTHMFVEMWRSDQSKYDDFAQGKTEEWRHKMNDPKDKWAPPKDSKIFNEYYKAKEEIYEVAKKRKLRVRLVDNKDEDLDVKRALLRFDINEINQDYETLSKFFDKEGTWRDIRKMREKEFESLKPLIEDDIRFDKRLDNKGVAKLTRDDWAKYMDERLEKFLKEIDFPKDNKDLKKNLGNIKKFTDRKIRYLQADIDVLDAKSLIWRNEQMASAIGEEMTKNKDAHGVMLVGLRHLYDPGSKNPTMLDSLRKENGFRMIRIDVLPVDDEVAKKMGQPKVCIGGLKGADYTIIVPASFKPYLQMEVQKAGKLVDSPHMKEWLEMQHFLQDETMKKKEKPKNMDPGQSLLKPLLPDSSVSVASLNR